MAEVKTYYQADEPTDLTPGTVWILEDGERRQRGTDGGWRDVGHVNLDNGGSVKRAGDSMDGALEGAHGLAPLYSPNFIGNAMLDDADLATKPWVNQEIAGLKQAMLEQISSATKQGSPSLSFGNSIAFGFGMVNHGGAVPLPKYSNNVPAKR